jgi:hypothetical protein
MFGGVRALEVWVSLINFVEGIEALLNAWRFV